MDDVPKGQKCDGCEQPATRVLSSRSSGECAHWFIGYYCTTCFDLVDGEMKKQNAEAAVDLELHKNGF